MRAYRGFTSTRTGTSSVIGARQALSSHAWVRTRRGIVAKPAGASGDSRTLATGAAAFSKTATFPGPLAARTFDSPAG